MGGKKIYILFFKYLNYIMIALSLQQQKTPSNRGIAFYSY